MKDQTIELLANQARSEAPALCEEFPKDSAISLKVSVVDVLSNYTVPGVLVGFTPGEVAIRVNERLEEQRTVTVRFTSFSFEGQVLYCQNSEAEFEAHISIDDVDKGLRRAPRFPVTLPAELLPSDGPAISIVIRDISRDGLGIESPCRLQIGRTVAIVSGAAFVFAVVRHCQPTAHGLFRAGVEMHHLFARPSDELIPNRQPSGLASLLRKFVPCRSCEEPETTSPDGTTSKLWNGGRMLASHRLSVHGSNGSS